MGRLVVEALAPLYDYAWFVGAGGAGLAYYLLAKDVRRAVPAKAS